MKRLDGMTSVEVVRKCTSSGIESDWPSDRALAKVRTMRPALLALVFVSCGYSAPYVEEPDASGPFCDGCWLGDQCKVGSGQLACGSGGAICVECSFQESCVEGRCVLSCDDTTCPRGCCFEGECVDGTTDALCGNQGAECSTCSAGESVCRGQVCEPLVSVTLAWNQSVNAGCPSTVPCAVTLRMLEDEYRSILGTYTERGCVEEEIALGEYRIWCGCVCCPAPPRTDFTIVGNVCEWEP